jgi:TetR/AcrR family transcriptional regulator
LTQDDPRTAPRQEADTEELILEAALIVFSTKGKDGARTQEIADLAGTNKALLHYYFRSKDRLYEAVFDHVLGKLVRAFGPRLQGTPPFPELVRLFVDTYIDFVADNLPVMRLMVNEHLSGGRQISARLKSLMQSEGAPPHVFVQSMRGAINQGLIRAIDPHQTLITLLSSCIFFFVIFPTVESIVPLAADDRTAFIEQRKHHIVDLVLHSLQPAAAHSS